MELSAVKARPSSLCMSGASVLHEDACRHVARAVGRCGIVSCAARTSDHVTDMFWPHHGRVKRPCVGVGRRRQERGGAKNPAGVEVVLSCGNPFVGYWLSERRRGLNYD